MSDSVGLEAAVVQRGEGRVMVDSVALDSPGYVVAYEDGGGAPGRVLGVSELLESGESRDVEIDLSQGLGDGSELWLVLHAEDGPGRGFGYGVGDPPIAGGDGVGVLRVELLEGE